VDFASDGKQALSKVLAHPYTLVVTDYRMPGMNGLELASAIGKAMPSLSVILVTGYPSPEVEGAAGTSNIDSILYKPLDPKRLRGAILTFLEKESRRDTGS
jgi:CheY-like chemotaxis protein